MGWQPPHSLRLSPSAAAAYTRAANSLRRQKANMPKQQPTSSQPSLEELSREPQPGIVVEFLDFLAHNKKWWLLPILIVMALVGALAWTASSGAGPFIYTLF